MRVNIQQTVAYETNSARSRKSLETTFSSLSASTRVAATSEASQTPAVQEASRRQAKSLLLAETRVATGLDMAMATDAAMQDAQSTLHEMRGLAIRSADGQISDAARGKLQDHFATLQNDLDDLQSSSTFLGINLLSHEANPVSFPVGPDESANEKVRLVVGGVDLQGVWEANLASPDSGGLRALSAIDTAQTNLTRRRQEVQDSAGQLTEATKAIQTMRLNLSSVTGRSQDAEVAAQMADLASSNIVALGGVAMQSQAQQLPKLSMNLLGA